MRTTRIEQSTLELDRLENDWWNRNADTIEKIWGLSYEIQTLIRLPYLKKAKAFFNRGRNESVVWEVGCGTGWVCRLIADERLRVIGTDFSEAQIALAGQLAKAFGKDAFCTYVVANASTKVEGHSGVLIHALLHHLSSQELDEFAAIIGQQPPGTRVFIYEPTFVAPTDTSGRWLAVLCKLLLRSYRVASIGLIRLAGRKQTELTSAVTQLFSTAEHNSWFLSPKEVPFQESELDSRIRKQFDVRREYFVNHLDLELAQSLAFYGITTPGPLFSRVVIPVATALDRLFFSVNFRSVSQGQYFFKCFELITR